MHEWHKSFLQVIRPLPKGTAPLDMKKGDDMYLKFLQVGSKVKCYVSLGVRYTSTEY